MKYSVLFVVAILFILNSYVFSDEMTEVMEFGNTICPISGEKIVEDEVVKYEYEGVIYNVCCEMCLKDFKKNPEKYIEKMEDQRELEEEKSAEETHEHKH